MRAMIEYSARLWHAQYFWVRSALEQNADLAKLGENRHMLASRLAAERFLAHEAAFMAIATEHGQDGHAVLDRKTIGALLKQTSTAAHGMAFSHKEAEELVGSALDTAEDILKQLRHTRRES
jgi:hypothetical protein